MFERFHEQENLAVCEFIQETTYTIWNQKMVGAILDCYTEDSVIHGSNGSVVKGAKAIIADTMSWLSAFPDLEIQILDIIWNGNAAEGYRVSMPWVYCGTNTGYSRFGAPTGKALTRDNNLGIANTLIQKINGKWTYVEEWSTYDKAAMQTACTPDLSIQEG